jgi:hypothetical protein
VSYDGYGWDGDQSDYVVVGASERVAGIVRTDGTSALVLSDAAPHAKDGTAACAGPGGCHGDVHNPTGGVSAGGQDCYGCHGLASRMEWDSPFKALHGHIVGKDGRAGDVAAYPDYAADSRSNVYCLSCHVDHDRFFDGGAVDDRAANLRTSVTGAVIGTNTDHEPGTASGICVSCHAAAVGDVTYTVSGSSYAGSSHDYAIDDAAKVGYSGGSAFRANCVKCHTDPYGLDTVTRQTGTFPVTPHASDSESRLARALGAEVVSGASSTEENLCFACHSPVSAGYKTAAGYDGYGVRSMSTRAEAVYTLVTARVSGHKVAGYSGQHTSEETAFSLANKHVECEDCHNPHSAGAVIHTPGSNLIPAGSPLAGVLGRTYVSGSVMNASDWNPANVVKPTGTGTLGSTLTVATREYEICLKCHSSANPDVWAWGSGWTDVTLEFDTSNESYHPVFGPLDGGGSSRLSEAQMTAQWRNIGNQTMYCTDCHGPLPSDVAAAAGAHGSSAPRMLKGYYPLKPDGTTAYTLSDVLNNTAQGLLCLNCHTMKSGSSFFHDGHGKGNHQGYPCTTCHLARPHGGKVSRLFVDQSTAGSPTAVNGTPAPYRGTSVGMTAFVKRTARDYAQNDCTTAGVCGTKHTASSSRGTIENW